MFYKNIPLWTAHMILNALNPCMSSYGLRRVIISHSIMPKLLNLNSKKSMCYKAVL